jgi:1-acyl-sn-glycerol-3-phosphate acyltransferase
MSQGPFSQAIARRTATAITLFARAVTAVQARWQGVEPTPATRIYFANHTSNGDFVLVWTVLPAPLRARTRPVAAADYWLAGGLRRFIGRQVFDAVLIERRPEERTEDPVAQIIAALDDGQSVILFPEGTRNPGPEPLLPFKSGLWHIARQRPAVECIPCWIANLNRVMPKGEVIPIPLVCTVTFGAPVRVAPEDDKESFLARARTALMALAPGRAA